MHRVNIFRHLMIGVSISFATWGIAVADAPVASSHVMGEQTVDANGTKLKVRVLKVMLPKGFKQIAKIYPIPGPRYVLKGRVRISVVGKSEEFGPGQLFWENGGQVLSENISDSEVDLLVTETLPESLQPKAKAGRGNNAKTAKQK